MTDIKATRKALQAEAIEALSKAEKALTDLIESYPDDKSVSAAHPRMGFSSTRGSVAKLKKAMSMSRI